MNDNKIRSSFSIGKDNILRYEFDFGNIKNEEIVDILETMKRKKKYYKLKSGDFLNLEENSDLQELERLIDEMDLSNGDLKMVQERYLNIGLSIWIHLKKISTI